MNFKKIFAAAIVIASAVVSISGFAGPVPEAGKEYVVLTPPQPTEAPGKIEVIEFFAYWCPHCNVLDPILAGWVKKQGAAISFKRVHIDFGNNKPLQRLFYTLEIMGKEEEFHSRIFKAIHTDRRIVRTDEDVLSLVADLGIDQKKYLDASQSFSVASNMARTQTLQLAYKVNDIGVPIISIDGHYVASPGILRTLNPALTDEDASHSTMPLLDYLVQKAQKEHSLKK